MENINGEVIRDDGTLDVEQLTIKFKALHESYIKEYRNACYDNNDIGKLVADAKRDLISDLADVFGLVYRCTS